MRRARADLTLAGATMSHSATGLRIGVGIHLPAYPRMVRVPGHPVYVAPELPGNYFFYDGLYWVLEGDDWHAGSWYNGPWERVRAERVPSPMLQVPVSHYRQPPPYFRGWAGYAPPHWGEHWGPQWLRSRPDWDQRDRRSPHPSAPLPTHQQRYVGARYPARDRQRELQERGYAFSPRDEHVREIVRCSHPTPADHSTRTTP